MKYSDIAKKTDKELEKLLEESRNEAKDLRQSLRVSEKTKPHEITQSRKKVARIMTELNQRKLQPAQKAQDEEKENA
ncbi:MAG: 50S ribosomal protein L29 [Candidatus Saccharimonadales bacterium]